VLPAGFAAAAASAEREADSAHFGIISIAAYDVDVPFMQLQRHGWDIHAV
jgi:hypothetical protein